jgi:hypothetical protein
LENGCYKVFMVIGAIRDFTRAVPFQPYEIQMVSGARYEVPHPDFIIISPSGSFVIVVDAQEHVHHLSSLLIERASPMNGRRKSKSARK